MADLRFYYIIMSSFAQHGTVKKYSLHRATATTTTTTVDLVTFITST